MANTNEQKLVAQVIRGDRGALGEVLALHQDRLFNICLRMVNHREDAADLTQETMARVIEHVDSYNGQCAISTWMVRIAMNLCISHLRKKKVRKASSLETAGQTGADSESRSLKDQIQDSREPSPDSRVENQELIALIHEGLQSIDDELRAVLVLRDIDQMVYKEIALVLDVPAGTVKSRLFRARLALRHEMMRLAPPPAATAQKGGA